MNATCKWNFDSRAFRFCADLYEGLGVPELAYRLPQRIARIGEVIGPLLPEVCRELGIRGAPLIVQSGIDAHMGTFGADAIMPGAMLLIGGTSNVHLTQIPDDGREVTGVWGPYPNALTPGLRMIEGGQVSAGSVLKWLSRDIFGVDDAALTPLLEAASAIEPEATGLLALDFWMGNRTPYRDARLRGALLGLSLSHDRASIYRAAVTAVALGAVNVVFDLEHQGVAIERIVLAGGIQRNPLWMQATIDALGKEVEVAEDDNLSLYGCAVSASVGLGLFPDLPSAAKALRAPVRRASPHPRMQEQYRRLLKDYRATVDVLTPILHKLSDRADRFSKGQMR
jgi:ribulose kinase